MSHTPSPTALFFHSDAIEGDGRDLVGRRSAGQSFLRGYLDDAADGPVRVLTQKKRDIAAFQQVIHEMGVTNPVDGLSLQGKADFARFGTIFFPGPGYMDAPWRRQHLDATGCSLVGITHTVSTKRVMDSLFHLMLQPIQPWDAIICTSRAVQSVVQTQMDRQVDYITAQFGASRTPVPQLPVIPLGIHADDFAHSPDARTEMRRANNAPDDAIVVMSMGRLTVVEKANPIPLFKALEQVAQTTGKTLHLWLVGWASTPDEHHMHVEGAKIFCPSVAVHIIDGRDPAVRRDIWSGADIFTLPVDNIQETFGLVPVEAMAAGLPVVMPDWDGFRDTVVHGETGFLIPTIMAGESPIGRDFARRFADGTDGYLQYLMMVEQQTTIDMRAYVAALTDLVMNPDLRAKMGKAGVRHVRDRLDWTAVMPQYQALADELAAMRQGAQRTTQMLKPTEIDPFALYAAYPSQSADASLSVTHRYALTLDDLNTLDGLNGRNLYRRRLLPDAQTLRVAQMVAQEGQVDAEQVARALGLSVAVTIGTLLFLAKYDFVTIDGLGQNTA